MIKKIVFSMVFGMISLAAQASEPWTPRLEAIMKKNMACHEERISLDDVIGYRGLSDTNQKGTEVFHELTATIAACKGTLDALNQDHENNFDLTRSLVPMLQNISLHERQGVMSQGAHLCCVWDVHNEFYQLYNILCFWKKRLFPEDTIKSYESFYIGFIIHALPELIHKWEDFSYTIKKIAYDNYLLDGSQHLEPITFYLKSLLASLPKEVVMIQGQSIGGKKFKSPHVEKKHVNLSLNRFQNENAYIYDNLQNLRECSNKLGSLFVIGCRSIPFPLRHNILNQEFPQFSDMENDSLHELSPLHYFDKIEDTVHNLRNAFKGIGLPYEDTLKLNVLKYFHFYASQIEEPLAMFMTEGVLRVMGLFGSNMNPFMNEPFLPQISCFDTPTVIECESGNDQQQRGLDEVPITLEIKKGEGELSTETEEQSLKAQERPFEIKEPKDEDEQDSSIKTETPKAQIQEENPETKKWLSEKDEAIFGSLIDKYEEEEIYDANYWRQENEKYAQKKNQVLREEPSLLNGLILMYEKELFMFIHTYVHLKAKITWRDIKKSLGDLEFSLVPNNIGNGSCYFVKPTSVNLLFGKNRDYKDAYFNVHKFPVENEPIHPSYIRFIDSGFATVFGLSEAYYLSRGFLDKEGFVIL